MRPLTEAVAAAHERGILHRDLKPANVMVTSEPRLVAERPTLIEWADKKGEAVVHEYQQKKNRVSIDGLPTGLPPS